MKTNTALQVIFAFFLGLVVVAFVGIGVNTFYPEPVYTETGNDYSQWRLTTGIILLVCATVLLAVSLLLPEHQAALSNGVLLGGVFTMVYAVGVTVSSDRSVVRFVVALAALAVTIGIGYLKFSRRRLAAAPVADEVARPAPGPAPAAAEGAETQQWAPPATGGGAMPAGDLGERLAAVERKLDALARALHG